MLIRHEEAIASSPYPLEVCPMATAVHAYPSETGCSNVSIRRLQGTINGSYFGIRPTYPASPAWVTLTITRQFGRPSTFILRFNPGAGWTSKNGPVTWGDGTAYEGHEGMFHNTKEGATRIHVG